ncbi:hypothetical protein [Vibrio vulnificus]|uniref:hypothetical protein n=1 Tax=Vibrio vulnificus TaxID=672 RepID=UPI0001591E6E|nr:hypothetical protein [Vibrio vulnificus]EGQ7958050.1 hypothetical protein [Vibrio vulnificus]EGQ7984088.1 hypothetical protein [Vibrio vulnificus]EGQ7988600.1 hypothetical protein [Vibrio vulnificus]EGQ9240517.1 hypothetical protein [Vibrio vulnificus]EGR0352665.1 hypothetical protein [Vibrio vulnificus]
MGTIISQMRGNQNEVTMSRKPHHKKITFVELDGYSETDRELIYATKNELKLCIREAIIVLTQQRKIRRRRKKVDKPKPKHTPSYSQKVVVTKKGCRDWGKVK